MTSGIYKLTFKSGHFYIGKSKDIARRWKEHTDKFDKGTAAKNMQWCFNNYGHPSREVLYEAHPEHLDVLEPIVIANSWGPNILNTTKEVCADDMRDEYLDLCKLSLGTLCQRILKQNSELRYLKQELEEETDNFNELIEDIKSGTQLKRIEQQLKVHKKLLRESQEIIVKLKNRTLLQRIFNYD